MSLNACQACDAPLAAEQRYCLNCGQRLAAASSPFAGASALVPAQAIATQATRWSKEWSGAFAMAALTLGYIVGVALGPGGLQQVIAQSPLAAAVASATDPAAPAPVPSAGGAAVIAAVPDPAPAPAPAADPAPVTPEPPAPDDPKPGKHIPAEPPATTLFKGTVVHVNPAAESYSLATDGGPLVEIHATTLPTAGAYVRVQGRELSNLTIAEAGTRKVTGTSQKATFTGTVSDRDPIAGTYAVSTRGASVLVTEPAPGPNQVPDAPPELGAHLAVTVTIVPNAGGGDLIPPPGGGPDPCVAPLAPLQYAYEPLVTLRQDSVSVDAEPLGSTDLGGIVETTCSGPKRLMLSGDDIGESGRWISLTSQPGIDASVFGSGESVIAAITLGANGYKLTGLASDDGVDGADDPETAQGDFAE